MKTKGTYTAPTEEKRSDRWVTLLGMLGISASFLILGIGSALRGESGVKYFLIFGAIFYLGWYFVLWVRKMEPWCRRFSRVCVGCLITIAVLLVFLLLGIGFPVIPGLFGKTEAPPARFGIRELTIPFLRENRNPWAQMLLAAFRTFCAVGLLLTLIRKESRKTALILLGCGVVLLFAALIWGLPQDTVLWFDNLGPFFCGVYGALFNRLYGEKAQQAYDEQMKVKLENVERKRQAEAAETRRQNLQAVKSTVSPRPPLAPKNTARSPASVSFPKKHFRPSAVRREAELKDALRSYQERRRKKKAEDASRSAGEMLPEAALRLLPGEETFAHLDGQRQLFIWLTELPCLRPLRESTEAQKLMEETLEDDPAVFLPKLQAVTFSVEKMIEEKIWEDEKNWQTMTAEEMMCAWYALRMYARMSSQPDLLELTAEGIAGFMNRDDRKLRWLWEHTGKEETG